MDPTGAENSAAEGAPSLPMLMNGPKENAASLSTNTNGVNRSAAWENRITVEQGTLRPVIIDGSNVARQLGGNVFATRGIFICARYFVARGHPVITFVPYFRRTQRQDNFRRPMKDQHLLDWLHDRKLLVYTPSRCVTLNNDQRRRIICYDDYNIVEYAHKTGGVIVSNDQYRDVMSEHPEWAETIRNRLVMFSWAGEVFMVAEDPFGRRGPHLAEVLRYGKDDRVVPFVFDLTAEQSEKLVKEMDEVLCAPPPVASADAVSVDYRYGSSVTSDYVDPRTVPRFGFSRRENNSFNHRSRRWMTEPGWDKYTTATFGGFRTTNSSGWDYEYRRSSQCTNGFTRGNHVEKGDHAMSDFLRWFSSGDQSESDNSDWDAVLSADSVSAHQNVVENEQLMVELPRSSNTPISDNKSTANNIDPLFDHFCDIFPRAAVENVFNKYKRVQDRDLLANILADSLIQQ